MSALTAADGMPITLYGSLGITPAGMQSSGDAQYIIFPQPAQDGLGQGIQTIDLTGPAPAPAVQITKGYSAGLSNFAIGPDGCLYIAGGPAVTRITNTDGTCNFGPTTQPPTISLTPTTVSPNPTQGGSQSFTASFHGASVPAGTPIVLTVTGDNHQVRIGRTDAAGQTSFSYTGLESGNDNVVASATVNNAIVNSNPVQVTWNSGPDTTFLTLNPSPKDGMPGLPVTFVANLTDISQNPQVPLSGEPITISLGTDSCNASTDANGNASCTIPMPTIIPGSPNRPLTATFAGTSSLTASNASASFTFVAPPEHAQLIVGPIPRYFPNTVELGGVGATSPIRRVTVYNPKKIKTKISVTFLGADNGGVNGGDFNILDPPATTCGDSLAPRSYCKIALTFTPTAPGLRKGRLIIADNAERNTPQKVPLRGVGVKGHIRFTPDELLFGKELIGNTSGEQTVTVKNHNPLPMTFAAATRGDFQITFNGCPSTLPAAPSSTTPYTCQISVDFHPTAAGPLYGALVFTDDAAQSPQKVHLSGTGVP